MGKNSAFKLNRLCAMKSILYLSEEKHDKNWKQMTASSRLWVCSLFHCYSIPLNKVQSDGVEPVELWLAFDN